MATSEAQRIERLQARHRELDMQVATEEARPLPNRDLLARLKRQRLACKDQLGTLLPKSKKPAPMIREHRMAAE